MMDLATISKVPTKEQVLKLQIALTGSEGELDVDAMTSHHFCQGLYARQMDIPKGVVVVGKTHTHQNFFVLTKGEMTIWTPTGMRRVKAPFLTVTNPGDKRVGYAHEDSITINFLANPDDETDLVILEQRYTEDEYQAISELSMKLLGAIS